MRLIWNASETFFNTKHANKIEWKAQSFHVRNPLIELTEITKQYGDFYVSSRYQTWKRNFFLRIQS